MARRQSLPLQWLVYAVARVVVGLLERLPIGVSYRCGRLVGAVSWYLYPGRRRITIENLRIIYSDLEGEAPEAAELKRRAGELFRRAGANLISGFRFVHMPVERMIRHIEITGVEDFVAALPKDRGAIVILAHMGPWEILGQLAVLLRERGIDNPVGALYRPINNSFIDRWFRREREIRGTRLLSRKDGFLESKDFIYAGGIYGILSDQRAGRGPEAEFFGRPVKSTPMPCMLHKNSGAPLLSLSITTVGPAHWRLRLVRPEPPTEGDLADRPAMAAYVNRVLEEVLSDSVLDGFWVHDRFRIGPAVK